VAAAKQARSRHPSIGDDHQQAGKATKKSPAKKAPAKKTAARKKKSA
jgi:hypothetical protein